MIIGFKFKNFRSIRDMQSLSMVVSDSTKELIENTVEVDPKLRLLHSAVIYGPNAGGKSNIYKALSIMQDNILNFKYRQPGKSLYTDSFAFDTESCKEPTEFEILFIKDDIQYQYGYIFDSTRVYEEWLIAYPLGRPQQWFNRVYDKLKNNYSWKFSKHFKHHQQIVSLTREDVLFLSNAVDLNNDQLKPIFDWFQNDLIIIHNASMMNATISMLKTVSGLKRILKFMNRADPSISNIIMEDVDGVKSFVSREDSMLIQNFKEIDLTSFFNTPLAAPNKQIKFIHKGNFSLDLENESDGTRLLLKLSGYWLDAMDNGKVIIVDELDKSLHPLVVQFLTSTINNSDTNTNHAQLIFTTHDTSLLNDKLFRRDQVWFVEKDEMNSTKLYPLSDFSPRKDEAIGRGYLKGKYGAIPYIGEWKF